MLSKMSSSYRPQIFQHIGNCLAKDFFKNHTQVSVYVAYETSACKHVNFIPKKVVELHLLILSVWDRDFQSGN